VNLSPARTIQPFPTEAAAREFLHRLLPETNLLHLNAQRFLIGDFTSSSPSGASRLKYLGRFWGFPFSFQLGDGSGASTDSSEAPTSEDAKIAEGLTPTLPDSSFSGWTYRHCTFKTPWCKLLSQSAKQQNLCLYESSCTFGSCLTSDFTLHDRNLGAFLCKITRIQRNGNVVAVLDITGTGGPLRINKAFVIKNVSHELHSGDELVFGLNRSYAFVSFSFLYEICNKYPDMLSDVYTCMNYT
jgi:hypothetical protein